MASSNFPLKRPLLHFWSFEDAEVEYPNKKPFISTPSHALPSDKVPPCHDLTVQKFHYCENKSEDEAECSLWGDHTNPSILYSDVNNISNYSYSTRILEEPEVSCDQSSSFDDLNRNVDQPSGFFLQPDCHSSSADVCSPPPETLKQGYRLVTPTCTLPVGSASPFSPRETEPTSCNSLSPVVTSISDIQSGQESCAEICYGTIVDAYVAPFRSSEVLRYFRDCNSQGMTLFHFRYRVDGIAILATSFGEVGELEHRYAQVLKYAKASCSSLRCEAYLVESHSSKKIKAKCPELFLIEINVYGSEDDSERLGVLLSESDIHLQEPDHLEENTVYRNPHVLSFGDDFTTPLFRKQHSVDKLDFKKAVDAIIYNSEDLESPSIVVQDWRLKSQLHSHQRSALQFMLTREQETIADENLTLWELQYLHDRRRMFKHKITGTESRRRLPECRGGLLSDEMGMGKSCSVLALIVHSLEQAELFKATPQFDRGLSLGQRRCRATLVVTPKSTIQSWLSEIDRHIAPSSLNVHVFYGQSKCRDSSYLGNMHLILTTYETIVADWKSPLGIFRKMDLFRIVLDEAHNIRNSSTQCFQAVYELRAQRRWCLTGTPIQNKLGDIFSLSKFLRYSPFDYDSSIRKYIKDPLLRNDQLGLDNLRFMMKVFSLRRVKTLCGIPDRHERTVAVTLAQPERRMYEGIKEQTLSKFLETAARSSSKSRHVILQGILSLRQLCSHGSVSRKSELWFEGPSKPSMRSCHSCLVAIRSNAEPDVMLDQGSCSECGNALQSFEDSSLATPEGSLLVDEGSEFDAEPTLDQVQGNEQSYQLSSKLNTVVYELLQLQQQSINGTESQEKSLVFSSWKKSLAYLQAALSSHGIKTVQINGEHSLEQRTASINTFQSDPKTTVMLLTIGSGSVGLNLTAASHVHIVEPHWNPMVEEQAAARVHRIGQQRPVYIHRYIVTDSVEERIKNMQKRKLWYAELTNCDSDRRVGEEETKDLEALL